MGQNGVFFPHFQATWERDERLGRLWEGEATSLRKKKSRRSGCATQGVSSHPR